MKKIISYILLLVMCVSIFAGCAPKEDENLIKAKDYLYAMYKDTATKTASDYTVVSQVRVGDVAYPITWTADVAEDKVKITAGENNLTTIDVNEATPEDVNYTLTGTLTNKDGLTASVSFKFLIPASAGVADGTYVIVAGNMTLSALAAEKNYGYPTGTEVTVSGNTVTGYTAADVLTIKNVDGGVTIQDASGRYFYLKGTYNSFNVDATAPAEGHIWKLVKDGDKLQLVNVMNNKTLAYSTSYTSWGAYPELSDDHNANIAVIAATPVAGDTAPEASTPAESTPPATQATTPPATQAPATEPPAAAVGASVTFDFTSLNKKGEEIKAEDALALFKSVASGDGLTAVSSITKIYDGNSNGGAHENKAGFIRCGKSDIDGELVLTFAKKVAKVEILCHDWYAKSEKFPTNSNQVAINGGSAQLAPYNETGAAETMTFNLDGSSNTVDFDFSNTQSGKTGRVFIFKMIVTFAE